MLTLRKKRHNYKTTQTLRRIMEQKGFVRHEVNGRVSLFRQLVSRRTVDRNFVRALLAQNFGGSASGLFLNLLESARTKRDRQLEKYLHEYRKRTQHGDPDPE